MSVAWIMATEDVGIRFGGQPRPCRNTEEREILEKFERGELRPASEADREMETAPRAARNTFNKTRRVNLRVTELDFSRAHARAREEGIPYQTLLSSVIHKYLAGRLVEKPRR